MISTPQSFANSQKRRNAPKRRSVGEPTTEQRDYITKISTRPNSVINFLQKSNSVSMEIIALLPILWKISRLDSFITCFHRIRTLTSTFSSLKPSGAPIIMNIIRPSAYTLTTFKILGESLISLDMILSSVKIGRVEPSLHAMMKDVNGQKNATTAMDGRNNNFTH